MRENFLDRFSPPEKTVHKSIPLTESEWRLVEAYQLYVDSHKSYSVPTKDILREILFTHLDNDRSFKRDKNKWIKKLSEIERTATEACNE